MILIVFGRMFGEVLELIFPSDDPTALVYFDAGIFALIGAVSFLGNFFSFIIKFKLNEFILILALVDYFIIP